MLSESISNFLEDEQPGSIWNLAMENQHVTESMGHQKECRIKRFQVHLHPHVMHG
jgi:hypothetical protein